jgi:hypothetical protein
MAATAENPVSHTGCKGKEDVQNFPAEVKELDSSAHPKSHVWLPMILNFFRSVRYNVIIVSSSREKIHSFEVN